MMSTALRLRPRPGRPEPSCRRPRSRSLTTLGIRREDPARVWERRVPLTPEAVGSLLSSQRELEVEVESCRRRCFSDDLYQQAGARIVDELSGKTDVVLGIKEAPVDEVHKLKSKEVGRERTWMMFSHTHKGQVYNTPLLSAFLDSAAKQTLIDHELLTAPSADGRLKRVAAFGWFAGAVGTGEALCLTGLALLKRGIATPLLHLPRPYTFTSLAAYKEGLRKVGDSIRAQARTGGPPIVIGLTGSGNVGTGAKDMLDAMSVEWVSPEQLSSLQSGAGQIYACRIPPSSYLSRLDGGEYTREDYYANPSDYLSTFGEKIAPHLTTLINGVGWQSGFPRTITNRDIQLLLDASASSPGGQRLAAIQDVSCDLKGGLEFVDRHTSVDAPYFEGPGGILISTTDILPTEMPADASKHFSSRILPYVERLVSSHGTGNKGADEIEATLQRAKIVDQGQITAEHSWLAPRVEAWRQTSPLSSAAEAATHVSRPVTLPERKKRVLLLGSGLVAGPAVDVFVARGDVELLIASNNLTEATTLVSGRANVAARLLDIADQAGLSEAVSQSDVVVSLLPAPMHPQVAKHCIEHGKHLVTASYVSPEMKALDNQAREKDVLLLGECGLDPGIDSMAAMRVLERVQREGKRVTSFVSWCGGLPEPSASNVPFGYKFSWSPKAVLTAALNPASYKLDNEIRHIPGEELLASHFRDVPLWKGLALEGLANRDSLPYAQKYGMGDVESMRDLFRGTLRYKGFSSLMDSFRKLGFLGAQPLTKPLESWSDFLPFLLQRTLDHDRALRSDDIPSALKDVIATERERTETEEAMRWLSLLPDSQTDGHSVLRPPPSSAHAPIDLFANLLSQKLAYAPHERDSCLLHHTFKLAPSSRHQGPGEEKKEMVTASLLCNGDDQASAMSVTVGKTLAFAAGRVLDGHVRVRGVTGPYDKEVWSGVLDDLEGVGVRVNETW